MLYHEVAPCPELTPYVECIWMLRSDASVPGAAEPILPDGCVELVIHFGDRFCRLRENASEQQPRIIFAGQMLAPLYVQPTGATDCLGVRFRSEAGAALLGRPLADFTAETVDVGSFDRCLAAELESLAELDPGHRIAPLQALLLRRLRRAAPDPLVSAAVRRFREHAGLEPVAAVCQSLGVSLRRLERRFAAEVGLSPKRFARIVRFQAMLRAAASGRPHSLVHLALDHGYYDQAHLVHEFRQLAGQPPAALLARMESLTRVFLGRSDFYKTA